jgi:hypothetical protein
MTLFFGICFFLYYGLETMASMTLYMQAISACRHWRRQLDNWGGGGGGGGGGEYSYIRVHRPLKQSISKEINNAEHEDMNIRLPQLSSWRRHCLQAVRASHT